MGGESLALRHLSFVDVAGPLAIKKKGYLQRRIPLGEPTKEQSCPNQCQAEPNAFLEEEKCSLSDANEVFGVLIICCMEELMHHWL